MSKNRTKKLLAKAAAASGDVSEATAYRNINDREKEFDGIGAVSPDYDPESLLKFVEIGPHLRPNIDAYAQNIDGYGHQKAYSEPWLKNLDEQEAFDAVKQSMMIEQWAIMEENMLALGNDYIAEYQQDPIEEPTDEEVNQKIEEIKIELTREEFLFDSFFNTCCSTMSFVHLRRIVRQDIESHGWGCIEKQKDGYGRLKRLSYVPAYTVRPMVSNGELIAVSEPDPITPLSKDRDVIVKRRFTIYVQLHNGSEVYFKSPGDPRVISRETGEAYDSLEEMRRDPDLGGEGKDAEPANELIWISQHSPTTECPPPRWIGNLLVVLGGREADETNYFYLRDNAIPAGLLFVSGGTISTDIKARLESKLRSEFQGASGTSKMMVVQATPMEKTIEGNQQLPQLTFQSLRDGQQSDSLFSEYDKRAADRIGASFRLSPILRGYTPSALNRATAIAAIDLAEQQVFQPEREDFDWIINNVVLRDLGINYLTFVSNSPPTRSVDDVVEIIKTAAPQGGLNPQEVKTLVSDLLNRPLEEIKEDWGTVPMVMTLAGINPDGTVEEENDQMMEMKLANIEARVSNVVTDTLKEAGFDYQIQTAFVDR